MISHFASIALSWVWHLNLHLSQQISRVRISNYFLYHPGVGEMRFINRDSAWQGRIPDNVKWKIHSHLLHAQRFDVEAYYCSRRAYYFFNWLEASTFRQTPDHDIYAWGQTCSHLKQDQVLHWWDGHLAAYQFMWCTDSAWRCLSLTSKALIVAAATYVGVDEIEAVEWTHIQPCQSSSPISVTSRL